MVQRYAAYGWQVFIRVFQRYFAHDIGRQAAALAYYLLFTLFPFLIFVSSLLGLLELDISGIMHMLAQLLPKEILELIEAYLLYVADTSSAAMLWFGLAFSVWFPMRAVSCLMRSVRGAYHLDKPKRPLRYGIKVLLYTILLLVTIAMTLVLMTIGQRSLQFIEEIFPMRFPDGFVEAWRMLRFIVLAVLVFAAVGLLYAMAQDTRQPSSAIVPGAILALMLWMLLSWAYSIYVESFSNYSVIYGALGTVIVLLIWLYLTAVVLIIGAEVNDTLQTVRKEHLMRFLHRGRIPPIQKGEDEKGDTKERNSI